jgi:hypothetical protein
MPYISNASVVVAFCQGVRAKKMLVKLTTHNIQDVTELGAATTTTTTRTTTRRRLAVIASHWSVLPLP